MRERKNTLYIFIEFLNIYYESQTRNRNNILNIPKKNQKNPQLNINHLLPIQKRICKASVISNV